MSKPTRSFLPSSNPPSGVRTFFVTSATWERRPLFRSERMARLFLETLYAYRDEISFRLHEFSLMPDHFRLLLSVPPGMTLEKLIQLVKGGFSYRARRNLGFSSEIRQRGFADQYITNTQEFETRKQYVRSNPVAAKLVVREEEYPYSSAHPGFAMDPRPEHLCG
ncbi:MAG: REP-associated tyrosine transposase [Terriglobia bacterium]